MKLHLDQNAFRVLINTIHEKTGYRTDVLEKDYYIVLILRELADMQRDGLQAYFKGGTALYKALRTTRRFSEDIDLFVDTRGCSTAQNNKRLERATKRYEALPRDPSQSVTHRSEVISVYNYIPVTAYDADDALQRFGKLKIEATSFTISEPTESLEVSALIMTSRMKINIVSWNPNMMLHRFRSKRLRWSVFLLISCSPRRPMSANQISNTVLLRLRSTFTIWRLCVSTPKSFS